MGTPGSGSEVSEWVCGRSLEKTSREGLDDDDEDGDLVLMM